MRDMLEDEFPEVQSIKSRPRHPQTNGLIECANGALEARILAWKLETGRSDWAWALPMIVRWRNGEVSRTINTSAFSMFFGRNPRSAVDSDLLEEDEEFDEEIPAEEDDDDDEDQPFVALEPQENQLFMMEDSDENQPLQNENRFISLEPSKLYLLFSQEGIPPKAEAIAVCYRDQLRDTVHGEKLSSDEAAFQVVRVLKADFQGPDEEPLEAGTFIRWKLKFTSDDLGNTLETVESRTPAFIKYLQDRGVQNILYQKQLASRRDLTVGDHVLMPIPKVDRSGTCPKNLEAEVMEKLENGYVRLGTDEGRISVAFRQEQLHKVDGKKRKITVPEREIQLTKAFRSTTSYSASVCKCSKSCSNARCKCFKAG